MKKRILASLMSAAMVAGSLTSAFATPAVTFDENTGAVIITDPAGFILGAELTLSVPGLNVTDDMFTQESPTGYSFIIAKEDTVTIYLVDSADIKTQIEMSVVPELGYTTACEHVNTDDCTCVIPDMNSNYNADSIAITIQDIIHMGHLALPDGLSLDGTASLKTVSGVFTGTSYEDVVVTVIPLFKDDEVHDDVDTPEVEPEVSPEIEPEVSPDVDVTPSPEVTPAPEVSPEVEPEVSPEVSPEVEPETTPNRPSGSVTLSKGFIAMVDSTTKESVTFTDIEDHNAYDAIVKATTLGIFEGTDDNLFLPDETMNRAMLATVIARLDGADLSLDYECTFTDVDPDAWYSPAVAWAQATGVMNGVGDNQFNPNGALTKEQIATVIYNYATTCGVINENQEETLFEDHMFVSAWATKAVGTLNNLGILDGGEYNVFSPLGAGTRAEVATALVNFVDILG